MSKPSRFKGMRIAAKLLIWFLLVAVSSLALVGFAGYRISKQSLEENVSKNLVGVLDARVRRIEAYVREREKKAEVGEADTRAKGRGEDGTDSHYTGSVAHGLPCETVWDRASAQWERTRFCKVVYWCHGSQCTHCGRA